MIGMQSKQVISSNLRVAENVDELTNHAVIR